MELNTLLTAVGLALLLVLTSTLVGLALVVRKTWQGIHSFITAPAENQQSPLGMAMDLLAHRAGQAMAMEIKTTFMGKESALKRGEQAVAGAVAEDMLIEGQPLLSGLLQGFPTLKKKLFRNPGLVGAALSLLGGNGQAGGRAPTGGGGGNSNANAFHI